MFADLPYALGISGGFASPLAAELLQDADVILIVGASANHWTTKHGAMIGPDAVVIQVDVDPRAIGRNRPADIAVLGDAQDGGRAHRELVAAATRNEASAPRSWPREIASTAGATSLRGRGDRSVDRPPHVDIALNAAPRPAPIAVDSGDFLGYPSMYLDVPDARSWVFPNGFQAVGLGLGNAIGAAIAHRIGRRWPRSATAARSWHWPSSRRRLA